MKTLKKIELILGFVIVLAMILKLIKLQISGIILVTSMSSLALVYLINAFASFKTWKVTKAASLLNFSFCFFGSFLVCAILYLTMFWPGGKPIVTQVLNIYFILLLVAIIYSFFKYKENKYVLLTNVKSSFIKITIVLFIGYILGQMSTDLRVKLFAINPDKARDAIESSNE